MNGKTLTWIIRSMGTRATFILALTAFLLAGFSFAETTSAAPLAYAYTVLTVGDRIGIRTETPDANTVLDATRSDVTDTMIKVRHATKGAYFQTQSGVLWAGYNMLNAAGQTSTYFGYRGSTQFRVYDALAGQDRILMDTAGTANGNIYLNPSNSGKVGIGTTSPSARLHVVSTSGDAIRADGVVESSTGGFKFPDGTIQTTAASGSGGDITAVNAGEGLSGGSTSGDATLSADTTYLQRRVYDSCVLGESIRQIKADGSIICEVDDNSGGTITGVTAGTGLSGGGSSGSVTVSADTSYLQRRVAGCPTGSAIRTVNSDGSAVCTSSLTHNHLGEVWSGPASGIALSLVQTDASGIRYGLYGETQSTAQGAAGVYGIASTGGSGSGSGVYGVASGSSGYGVYGLASRTSGTNYGVYGRTSSPSGYGVYFSGGLAGTGVKSAIVETQDYGWRSLYAVESPQNWFEDFGQATLTAGEAVVEIEPIFAQTVNLDRDYHVFLTPRGGFCSLYVAETSSSSFTVRAAEGSGCEIAFDYRIIAPRLDYEDLRLKEAEDPEAVAASLPVAPAAP